LQLILNPHIPDQEEKALSLLGRLLLRPWKYADKVGILNPTTIENLSGSETIDAVAEVSPTVAEYLLEQVEAQWEKRRVEKAGQWMAKAHNRVEYLATGTIEMREAKSKSEETIHRWHGEIRLANAGLISRMVETIYGAPKEPVTLSVVNMLPPSAELGLRHAPVNPIHWEHMLEMGMAVSGERVAWQMNSPAWALLLQCFPQAIEMRAYNHSLNAPLIAGGYIPDVEVTFSNLYSQVEVGTFVSPGSYKKVQETTVEDLERFMLRDIDKRIAKSMKGDVEEMHAAIMACSSNQEMEEILNPWGLEFLLRKHDTKLYKRVPMMDDGSGRYHPDCPQLAELVARYGCVPMQVRAVDAKDGVFAKGILIPDMRALDDKGNPTVIMSWAQIKGRFKSLAGERKKQDGRTVKRMHLGILRVWDRKRFMTGCFELLENIGATPRPGESRADLLARKGQINEDLNSMVDETMDDLGKDGINGLLASIAKDDKMLSLVVKLIAKAASRGIIIDPMSIDRVRQAMDQKLQRRLWGIAQGAGIDGRQLVIVIDGGLARGKVVCTHYKTGSELAVWRFPLVLAQGLQTHKVVAPRPHHLLKNGEGVDQTIFMNPEDVLDMQGDDDGDIVASTTDKRVIRLFREKIDNRRYAIEPQGEKLQMAADSEEGLKYLRSTPMGPVGLMTMNRAKLLAVGDQMGALAMSVLVQESIDKAKRKVRWSDWEKATHIENWREVDGMWRLHYEGSTNYLDNRPEEGRTSLSSGILSGPVHDDLPVEQVAKWIKERLARYGCHTGKGSGGVGIKEMEDGVYIDMPEGGQSPIGWRIQYGTEERQDGSLELVRLNKRIQPTHWTLASEQQKGYMGGNLVHRAHDRAWSKWQEISGEFGDLGTDTHYVDPEMQSSISNLLIRLLREEGATAERPAMSWFQYMDCRAAAGITEFSEAMKKALAQDSSDPDGSDNSDRFSEINAAYELLRQRMQQYSEMEGLQGLVDIWCMETTPMYRYTYAGESQYTTDREEIPEGAKWARVNNPNHAINAVCWPGSPVLKLLGIEGEDVCGFLTADRLKKVIETVTVQDDAFKALAGLIWQTDRESVHQKVTRIPVWDCQHCKDTLQTALVRYFRAAKRRTEKAFLGRIVGELNGKGNTELGVGDASALGINVAKLMQMSPDELETIADGLRESTSRQDRAKLHVIEKILEDRG
jgi:hypothetical protein